jgi:hypothetical protein
MSKRDREKLREINNRDELTLDDKVEIFLIAMSSEEGKALFKEKMLDGMPPELRDAYVSFIDGKTEDFGQAIEDNVLDAVSEGRWSAEDAGSVLRFDGGLDDAAMERLKSKAKK